MKSTLFQEAIADAKAVRATALANAKAALEEAFTPKLQSMLGARLKEELEEDDEMAAGDHTVGGIDGEDDNVEITSDEIDSILKELDNDIKNADAPDTEVPVVGDATDSVTVAADAAPAAEVKTIEAPVMVVAPVADAPVADAPVDDEEVNLEELLAELDSCDLGDGDVDVEEKPVEEDIDLNELLKSLSEKETEDVSPDELVQVKEQFAEACKTIEFLRGQLNEVNLLNAKLLYTNKLFKAHALNNTHKMKIIESFDLAKSVREVKLTYNNLSEALSFNKGKTSKKSTIVESFASQSVGTTKPAESIVSVRVNEMASRFQELAGIKK